MTRRPCPFCGHIHVRVVTQTRGSVHKSYVECPRCEARGPLFKDQSYPKSAALVTEAAARWDERRLS